jgi:hypothetical protein
MTPQELAQQLDGTEYPFYPSNTGFAQLATVKEKGLVVVYGASDDLMEFYGAIDDELGAYDGTTAYVTNKGLMQNKCDCQDCPYYEQALQSAQPIEALWDKDGISWQYKTDIPHATFRIVEDGAVYCIGLVFALADVTIPNR